MGIRGASRRLTTIIAIPEAGKPGRKHRGLIKAVVDAYLAALPYHRLFEDRP